MGKEKKEGDLRSSGTTPSARGIAAMAVAHREGECRARRDLRRLLPRVHTYRVCADTMQLCTCNMNAHIRTPGMQTPMSRGAFVRVVSVRRHRSVCALLSLLGHTPYVPLR